jgi:hypothetical protein
MSLIDPVCDVPGGVVCVVPVVCVGLVLALVLVMCMVMVVDSARVGSGGILLLLVACVVLMGYVHLVDVLLEVHVACVAQKVSV